MGAPSPETSKRDKRVDAKQLIKGIRRAERSVELCMRADLLADLQDLQRDLDEAEKRSKASGALDAGTDAVAIAERIEQLREEMADHSITFRVRALKQGRYSALIAAHPPREGVRADEQLGVNSETFFTALLPESVVDPQLDDDDWATLLEELSDAQFNVLTGAAMAVNTMDVDIPFSRAASRITHRSAPE